ncbi:hypothetical protein APHWI1_0951 [Anaplasma phagocytophilum str. ApWI1]|uniref:Uncharacterized protein n=2 Tax=Anaplasma phagocytophilum TaxID=948 RepID=A0A0F3NL21_ANAPH|nr:hypothetical protein APHWEB_0566 [Anaplasma phagocytophilum str. Webster]KJV68417.1 hypothetical protein EPHNCH_0157 [Anaplasma phagocytophilum str. NCH-1]KJV82505.1 hypothetical protein APHHGE2_0178 [Anaplasma phagocytophilum str. HGE2]KJV84383.1 hypothetical protein APHWI1_0951 [Anaplasma phagocytophilum str. ApWI1]KJV86340.1 hypothetical protein APHNYW_1494 [Anaplasma phagocytophilum str. ApNYW]KJZ98999.1 hypothetical protein APHCR_0919 [Anaplasma phagocytophilum str. CR1007]
MKGGITTTTYHWASVPVMVSRTRGEKLALRVVKRNKID